jgi:endo-1,4-beta-xylanase
MDRRRFVTAGAKALGMAAFASALPGELFAGGQPTLKEVGAACGMKVGIASAKVGFQFSPPAYAEFVKSNCSIVTPENDLKWASVHPMLECYRFENADWLLDYAQQNGIAFRGHNLCWNSGNPPWLAQYLTKANAETTLTDYIAKIAGRYAGRIDSWDVVNEPVSVWNNKPGGLSGGPWLDVLGPEYIDIAFHAAAAADPHALRVLNLHHVEHAGDEQSRQDSLKLIETLLKRNVPVQGVGIESHLDCALPIDQGLLQKFVRSLRSMNLEVLITELDVNDAKVEGDFAHRDQVVADYYRRYLDIVLPVGDVKRLVFWSLSDHSWMDYLCKAAQWQRSDGSCNHRPGLLDTSFQIKPAYNAVIASIQNNCKAR